MRSVNGFGKAWLDPGSGPFPPCPPDPRVVFCTDPFRPASTTPEMYRGAGPTGIGPAACSGFVIAPPGKENGKPSPTSVRIPTAGTRIIEVQNPYGSEGGFKDGISLRGASPFGIKWSTLAIVLGGAIAGGAGLALWASRKK